jgi:hypothetical protein
MTDTRAQADRYAQAVLQAMVERWQGVLGEVADAVDTDPNWPTCSATGAKALRPRTRP